MEVPDEFRAAVLRLERPDWALAWRRVMRLDWEKLEFMLYLG